MFISRTMVEQQPKQHNNKNNPEKASIQEAIHKVEGMSLDKSSTTTSSRKSSSEKAHPARKSRRSFQKKKRAAADLSHIKHLLDDVTAKRALLCKKNEAIRGNLITMQEALRAMPVAIQQEKARLMAKNLSLRDESNTVYSDANNESIRRSLLFQNCDAFSTSDVSISSSCFPRKVLQSQLAGDVAQGTPSRHEEQTPSAPLVALSLSPEQITSWASAVDSVIPHFGNRNDASNNS